jgi:5-methylcytosine-specific restriction protein A
MPLRPPTPCSFRGPPPCPTLVYGGGGRCDEHLILVRRASNKARRERGPDLYGPSHRRRFRRGVLAKHPYCQCDRSDHAWHRDGPCLSPSTDADHWPIDKRTLIERGMDSDDPAHGRGLCHRCHSSATARLQPGGWHKPRTNS